LQVMVCLIAGGKLGFYDPIVPIVISPRATLGCLTFVLELLLVMFWGP
jgi:hypothetical protein